MIPVIITVRYRPRPNSNVGKYVATAIGRQASHTNDFTGNQYRKAADILAAKLGLVVVDQIGGGPDDRCQFSTKDDPLNTTTKENA